MKLEGDYTVPAPRPQVWAVLQDPALLARVLPGCEKLEPLGNDQYKAGVKIQVGPLQGAFEGTIALTQIVTPESYRMSFDGKGALGFVKGIGSVQLTEQGASTLISYAGDATTGGKIATVGQRLMETSAKALIKQTFDAITPIAQAMIPPPTPTTSTPPDSAVPATPVIPVVPADIPVQRPSQVAFGLGIMKHMFEDSVPESYRLPVLAGGGLLIVLFIVWLLDRIF
jgi:carbon monoxide dehydrogenase subunit G